MGFLRFQTGARLAILVCALALPSDNVRADVAIAAVRVDGQPLPAEQISPAAGDATKSLRLPSSMKSLQFDFACNPKPGIPLRYKLEGHDDAWHDLPTGVRIVLRYYQKHNFEEFVGSEEFLLRGQTSGWRGQLNNSDYVALQHRDVVPELANYLRVCFLTAGTDADLAIIGIDAVRVLVEHPPDRPPRVFDLKLEYDDKNLEKRVIFQPINWVRDGAGDDLARMATLQQPTRHPILTLLDDSPECSGGWSTRSQAAIPVSPGDRVTLQWRGAYCIGNSGPGTASYEQLPPGNYRFRVAAFNWEGEPAGIEASLPIEVVAPFYHRWEFWLAVAAAIIVVATWTGRLLLRRRMQAKIDRMERARALERERSRIARDLHDDLGANLTQIALLSELAQGQLDRPEAVRGQLDRIFQTARSVAKQVDDVVWAVSPSHDTLDSLANFLCKHVQDYLGLAGIRCRLLLPDELPKQPLSTIQRRNLFLAVKEALHNAVRHARPSLVTLRLDLRGNDLVLEIEDDGCGLPLSGDEEATQRASDNRDGLVNIEERLAALGGRCERSAGAEGGTLIRLIAPLPSGKAR